MEALVGYGPVTTLFLSLILFPAPHSDVGHGPFTTLFLSLILFLVPIAPYDTRLYWPSPNNWWRHRVFAALLTRRPIITVAMEAVRNWQLYILCIATVAFFSIFLFLFIY